MTRPYKPAHVSPMEWLFARVFDRTDDACWLWPGSTNGDGYGKTYVNGDLVLVHRLAYETFVGPIPEGMTVDHLCATRLCVRPSHMDLCTGGENSRRGWVRYRERKAALA